MIKNAKKSKLFTKVKNKHSILSEFIIFLQKIEQCKQIQKIIPGRINRQQKGSSKTFVHFAYKTISGLKYNMSKGGTGQELFIVCNQNDTQKVYEFIKNIVETLGFENNL